MPGNLDIYLSDTLIFLIEKSQDPDYFSTLECFNAGAIKNTDRDNLLSKVIDASVNLNLSISTGILACTYIDKFLSIKPNTGQKIFDLVAITGIALAAKYKEGLSIESEKIKEILKGKYAIDSIVTTEQFIAGTIGWKLGGSTICDVIESILECTFENEMTGKLIKNCYLYAAVCYCDLEIAMFGIYNLAICSIIMALEKSGFVSIKDEWLCFIGKSCEVDTKKFDVITDKIKKKLESF